MPKFITLSDETIHSIRSILRQIGYRAIIAAHALQDPVKIDEQIYEASETALNDLVRTILGEELEAIINNLKSPSVGEEVRGIADKMMRKMMDAAGIDEEKLRERLLSSIPVEDVEGIPEEMRDKIPALVSAFVERYGPGEMSKLFNDLATGKDKEPVVN